MAGPLGGDQGAVHALGRHDLAEMNVEPVRTEQEVAGPEVRLDLAGVDIALDLVGQQDIHQVAGLGGLGGRDRLEAVAHGGLVVRPSPAAGPTTTVQPESRRFWAWAWPWLP